VEVRILREDGGAAAAGETGEIAVRGPIVSPGYWGRHAPRAGGWHATGDLGRIDARGYLEVVGRKSEMIITGGENVSPAEVERVLLAHPKVLEAAVAGSADPRWGERVVAAVVPRTGASLTAGDLADHCRRHLAAYKVPRAIALVSALPRNALGKLLRREVAALAG
jgi:acyl-CoA synthetase (AMP-forming)/AMP-acid ligase II